MKPPKTKQQKSGTFETSAFKALKAKWYEKLEKSGFEDIEQDEKFLHNYDGSHITSHYGPEKFQQKQRYYELAGQFLHHFKFASARDKIFWRYHSEGKTNVWIARKVGLNDYTVRDHVRRITRTFKTWVRVTRED